MMEFTRPRTLPEDCAKDPLLKTVNQSLLNSYLAYSVETAYCKEDGKPLFLAGLFHASCVAVEMEFWFCPLSAFEAKHIRPCRRHMKELLKEYDMPIFARCTEKRYVRFVKLMGLKFVRQTENAFLFEVQNG